MYIKIDLEHPRKIIDEMILVHPDQGHMQLFIKKENLCLPEHLQLNQRYLHNY